jgi:hypothetical protein
VNQGYRYTSIAIVWLDISNHNISISTLDSADISLYKSGLEIYFPRDPAFFAQMLARFLIYKLLNHLAHLPLLHVLSERKTTPKIC